MSPAGSRSGDPREAVARNRRIYVFRSFTVETSLILRCFFLFIGVMNKAGQNCSAVYHRFPWECVLQQRDMQAVRREDYAQWKISAGAQDARPGSDYYPSRAAIQTLIQVLQLPQNKKRPATNLNQHCTRSKDRGAPIKRKRLLFSHKEEKASPMQWSTFGALIYVTHKQSGEWIPWNGNKYLVIFSRQKPLKCAQAPLQLARATHDVPITGRQRRRVKRKRCFV